MSGNICVRVMVFVLCWLDGDGNGVTNGRNFVRLGSFLGQKGAESFSYLGKLTPLSDMQLAKSVKNSTSDLFAQYIST